MKISISGHGGCGKDTIALWFKENTILKYTKSTSAYALPEIRTWLQDVYGLTYANDGACYADRVNHRGLWASFIDLLNQDDPAFLYRRCLMDQDILTGVRREREFKAVVDLNVVDLRIWIHMPGNPVDPTQGYEEDLCDITILNQKDKLAATHERLHKLCNCLGILKR